MSRASGFNLGDVDRFFNLLENLIKDHCLKANNIYNIDESGISTVQKKCQRVLGLKGKKQIGSIASVERGVNTTVVCCVNAGGTHYVPPMIIFKRKRVPDELGDGAPEGSIVTCSDSGWINSELFVQWMRMFISHVKPTKDDKVLLILDGHKSHTKNLEAIQLAIDNNVIMLSFPPHTTHKLQPLDKAFFKPLQVYYDQEVEKWLRLNPGRSVSSYQVANLFHLAYAKAATMSTAINGFASCGIWPCTRDVFKPQDYAPSFASQAGDRETMLSSPLTSGTLPAQAQEASIPALVCVTRPAQDQEGVPPLPGIMDEMVPKPTTYVTHPVSLAVKTSHSKTVLPQVLENFLLISIYSDGKCFFRSVVVCTTPDLQSAQRLNGKLVSPLLHLKETAMADSLRNQLVSHLISNLEILSVDMHGDALNADQPQHLHFNLLEERIAHIAKPDSFVGEWEINQISCLLKTKIVIHNANRNVLMYGEEHSGNPITVKYTMFENNFGHYEALIFYIRALSPIQRLVPVLPPKGAGKRKCRKEQSEILTSSPYKKLFLQESPKTNTKVKKSKNTKIIKEKVLKKCKKPKMNSTTSTCILNESSWLCFMCGECNRKYDMLSILQKMGT